MNNSIKASLSGKNYKVDIKNDAHTIYADEPESMGGGNEGFTPFEILSSSLAACTTVTLKMYSDRKNWLIRKIFVDISFSTVSENKTLKAHFTRNIIVQGENITDIEKERLLAIAESCPVSKILKSSNNTISSFIS